MTQYETFQIAENFSKWESESMYVQYVDKPGVLNLAGNLKGKSVIQYGCGNGCFTKTYSVNADKVIGIDISDGMIAFANEFNKQSNTEFYVRDATQILNLGVFDVAISEYFLNQAQTKDMLKKFLNSIYESLKPGGVCCGVTFNVMLKPDDYHHLRKYSISLTAVDKSLKDSNEILVEFLDHKSGKPVVKASSYYIEPKVIEETFKETGFKNFKWIQPTLNEEYKQYNEYLADYLKFPDGIHFYAEKS